MKFLDDLQRAMREEGEPFDRGRLEQELERFVRETNAFDELQEQWEQLVEENLEEVEGMERSLHLLTQAENLKSGVPRQDLLENLAPGEEERGKKLLQRLLEVFPLLEEETNIRCVSRLFGRWWQLKEVKP